MKNFDVAVKALVRAIKNGDKIGVNGDYDVDGTTAVAQAVKLLTQAGASHEWTIPHRERDGYGLSHRIAQQFIDSGCRLVLLFDHGSHNLKEIAALRSAGIQVLVFDHHVVGPELPDAIVVNPAQSGCGFFNYKPCASGLAFFLSQRVSEILNLPAPDCGLAALGTIADMVPLVGPNRTIAYQGLRALRTGSCRGVTHLAFQLSVSPGELSSVDVGFYVGPAINAAGRLDDARRCVELLTSADEAAIQKLASDLVATNEDRKEIQRGQLAQNYDRLAALKVLPRVLVSSHADHHQGVVGLTAQGLAQRHARPAFVFASGGEGTLKGSARAGGEHYDLSKMLADAKALDTDGIILKAGGHKAAAGLTIRADGLGRFTKHLSQAAALQMPAPLAFLPVHADAKLKFKDLTPRLVSDVAALLDPFGQGFAQPKILFDSVAVNEVSSYPGGRHVLVLEQDGKKVRAFVGPELWDGTIRAGCVIDLIAVPAALYKNDKHHVQLVVEGITLVSQPDGTVAVSQDAPPPVAKPRTEPPPIRLPQIVRPVAVSGEVRRDTPKYVELREAFIKAMNDLPRPFIYADLKDLVGDFFGPKLDLQREAALIALIASHDLSALRPDSFSVRPEQLEFIRWFLERSDNAILQAPTGSGKTEMALVIASKQRSMG
jgi:single-stranded-DNA-specific exonuclease RecJ